MSEFDFKYFTDSETNKDVKILISSVVGDIGVSIASHKYAWPTMLQGQLKAAGYSNVDINRQGKLNWSDYDVILIEHGMEFKGTFNIFGGVKDDKFFYFIDRLFTPNVRMYCYGCDMPLVGNFVKGRAKHGTELFKTLEPRADEINEICSKIPKVDHIDKTGGLVFGDSHSFSLWRPGYMSSRHDGLTLHGALTRGLGTYVYPWVSDLVFYMGNIDVRHHLMRQQNPLEAVDKLVNELETQLVQMCKEKPMNISVSEVLPIENPSRKIPKTGFYKGTPFMGSWEERTAISKYMNLKLREMCIRRNFQLLETPKCFFNDKGELDFRVMEKPQSVHISREFHIWDYENNKMNDKRI
jgi:hypothetical protein